MLQPPHLRHTACALDALHIGAKPSLPHARQDDCFALTVGSVRVLADVLFNAFLPTVEIQLPRRTQLSRAIDLLRDIRNLVGFAADEAEQRRGERPADTPLD